MSSFVDRMHAAEQTDIDELLGRAIYATGTPLSIVESPQWQAVFSKLRPSYTMPSRYSIATKLLDAEYARVSCAAEELIATSNCLGLMCDGWSNRRNQSIMNYIIITPSPVFFKSVPTGVQSHTGQFVAKEIGDVINYVGPSKFVGVVTDNASNMQAAWRILEEEFPYLCCYGCAAHGLQLLMNDLAKTNTVSDVVTASTAVIKEIKRSHKLSAILENKASSMQTTTSDTQRTAVPSLKLPVATRWGSNVTSLTSVERNKCRLQQLAVDVDGQLLLSTASKKNILSDVFWGQLNGVLKLLQPVAQWITVIESDKPQLSLIARLFSELALHFESTNSNPFTKQEQKLALASLAARREFC